MSNIIDEYEQFIRNIKKVVQLRDLQYEELMTTGKYVYTDPDTGAEHIVPKDPEALYVAPSYTIKWLIQKVYEASIKQLVPQHEPVVLGDLSEYVKSFMEEKFLNETYVAIRGVFFETDYIKYSDNYRLFINGVEYDHDYVPQNYIEYITVVIVGKESALNLKYEDIHFHPIELIVWRNRLQVTVENLLCSSAVYVTSNVEESCVPDLRSCKVLKLTTNETSSSNISPVLEELYFYGRIIGNYRFSGCTFLRKAYLPYVTTIGYGMFNNCPNLELEFKRLITQSGNGNEDCFTGIKSLTLPKSYITQSADRFIGNVNTLFLNCVNANFTKSLSYNRNSYVKHIVLGKNWNANLYLHNFTNLDADEMIETFNQLPDLTGQTTKTITLYSTFYDDLWNTLVIFDDATEKYRKITDEEAEDDDIILYAINAVDIVLNKEWTVIRQ